MREAQRSYEADLTVMDATKPMLAAPSICCAIKEGH